MLVSLNTMVGNSAGETEMRELFLQGDQNTQLLHHNNRKIEETIWKLWFLETINTAKATICHHLSWFLPILQNTTALKLYLKENIINRKGCKQEWWRAEGNSLKIYIHFLQSIRQSGMISILSRRCSSSSTQVVK